MGSLDIVSFCPSMDTHAASNKIYYDFEHMEHFNHDIKLTLKGWFNHLIYNHYFIFSGKY